MSKNKKPAEQNEQKVMTKYDLKMQKRQAQKEQEKKEQLRTTIISVVVVAALVCLVASFPIRTYMTINETYVTIGGEKISKLEFDYRNNIVKNNYYNQYGSYLSYFGLDMSGDLSTQMYSDTMTWEDFFQQMTVENISQNIAIKRQAEAEGFTYDVTEDYKNFEASVKKTAGEVGVSVKEYIKGIYGDYATMSRISEFVKEDMVVTAYYSQLEDSKAPADDAIQAYYEENKDNYESVDYRVTTVKAELPTEPTELADPVEETENSEATDETAEEAYEPSEAEIEKAMADAKVMADAAEAIVATEGELMENVTMAQATSAISDWLFAAERKAGDTTVIQDDINNQYYVLAFEKRYLDESPSADVRILITQEKVGQDLLDEWKKGEATEDSFADLCAEYSIDSSATNGGLCEGVSKGEMSDELSAWLFDEARVSGDSVAIDAEDGYDYVMYYVGTNEPAWKLNIKSTLLSDIMDAYLEEITASITVEDPKGNLNYLKVQEAEEAATESETAESTEAVEPETAESKEAVEPETAESTEATEPETAESTDAAEASQAQ